MAEFYTSFTRFVSDKYLKDNSPYGDFARDMKKDEFFPKKTKDGYEIKWHLERNNACEECIQAFEELWKEYKTFYYKGIW